MGEFHPISPATADSLIMRSFTRSFLLGALLLLGGGCALEARPYYTVDQIDQAKAEAHAKHLPIAWLSSPMVYLDADHANDSQGSPAELTTLALNTLQGQAVIIFQDADNDLPKMPANMVDRIETKDEGDHLPNGWHYTAPKIIYTDPDLVTFFGCTLAPDLRSDGAAAINIALLHIHNDPNAQALINGTAKPPTATADQPAPAPAPAASPGILASIDPTYVIIGVAAVFTIVAFLVIRNRS
jgi:hypothetical protein